MSPALSSFDAAQQAVVAAYAADAQLVALAPTLRFNEAQEGDPYPYATYFLDLVANHVGGGLAAWDVELQFNAYSAQQSTNELNQIKERILTAFNDAALTVQGHTLANRPRVSTATIFRPPDSTKRDLWQLVLVFQFSIKATP